MMELLGLLMSGDGNIILTPNQQFGLIDVADMKIGRFPLGYFKRLRNIKHFLRVKEDVKSLPKNTAIEEGYLSYCQIHNRFFVKHLLRLFVKIKQR